MEIRCAEMKQDFENKSRYVFWQKPLCAEGPKAPASSQDFGSLDFRRFRWSWVTRGGEDEMHVFGEQDGLI